MLETITIPNRIKEVAIKYSTAQLLPAAVRFSNSNEVFKTFRPIIAAERVEVFIAVLLDCKNRVMCFETVSRGSLSSSIVHPREALTAAVRLQAAAVIFLHNHPSGDPAPSREDRECTDRLKKASDILGIRMLDHIVIGDTDYFSFADSGALNRTT